jgi:hypothetical protein
MTPAEFFRRKGFSSTKEIDLIGLEFENEALVEFQLPKVRGWNFHPEGSLRHFGYEYVLSPPLRITDALKLTETLFSKIEQRVKEAGTTITNSLRTSVHVHQNVNEYSFLDIVNYACVYWILESLLSQFAGSHRQGNLFCLRLKDAAMTQHLLTAAIETKIAYGSSLFEDNYRYASLNFSSVRKFGSIENRLMSGTTDIDKVKTWVALLENIRKFALTFKTPKDLKEAFLNVFDAKYFPYEVFGENYSKLTQYFSRGFNVEKEVRTGFLEVLPILNSHPSFDFREEYEKEKALEEETLKNWRKAHEAMMAQNAIIGLNANLINVDDVAAVANPVPPGGVFNWINQVQEFGVNQIDYTDPQNQGFMYPNDEGGFDNGGDQAEHPAFNVELLMTHWFDS